MLAFILLVEVGEAIAWWDCLDTFSGLEVFAMSCSLALLMNVLFVLLNCWMFCIWLRCWVCCLDIWCVCCLCEDVEADNMVCACCGDIWLLAALAVVCEWFLFCEGVVGLEFEVDFGVFGAAVCVLSKDWCSSFIWRPFWKKKLYYLNSSLC